jgi:hypothetical protein
VERPNLKRILTLRREQFDQLDSDLEKLNLSPKPFFNTADHNRKSPLSFESSQK